MLACRMSRKSHQPDPFVIKQLGDCFFLSNSELTLSSAKCRQGKLTLRGAGF